jgi:PAS domain S-box-containing protein
LDGSRPTYSAPKDAAIYADRGGKIQLWNRAAAALFGYEAAETLGSSIDIIVPERLREPPPVIAFAAEHWQLTQRDSLPCE